METLLGKSFQELETSLFFIVSYHVVKRALLFVYDRFLKYDGILTLRQYQTKIEKKTTKFRRTRKLVDPRVDFTKF